jgi:tRNA 2-thiouridine synthesizing protein A
VNADVVVDASGQSCPMPVIMAAKAIKELATGQTMLVKATDAGARSDIPSWVEMTGNELVGSEEQGDVLLFSIRKA